MEIREGALGQKHTECVTCGRSAGDPFRRYDDRGKVVHGCIDPFHEGHLVTPSESSRWHMSKTAQKHRQDELKHLQSLGPRRPVKEPTGAKKLSAQAEASLEDYMKMSDSLNDDLKIKSNVLKTFPKGPMGLTPDDVKSSPEYRKAKADYDKSFHALQYFNKTTKNYAKLAARQRASRR